MFALTATEVIGESNVSWWDIALAALVVILAIIAARVAGRATARMVGRLEGIPPNTGRTIARTAAYTVLLLGFGVALSALGADIQPLQTAAIVAAVCSFCCCAASPDSSWPVWWCAPLILYGSAITWSQASMSGWSNRSLP